MRELNVERMETVTGGGLFGSYCQSDSASFLAGATLGGTVAGGGIGFVVGLGVGVVGGLLINSYGKAC